jgi:hypothetical protein
MPESITEVQTGQGEVVSKYAPPKDGYKGFNYYSHTLDGATDMWEELLGRLGPSMSREVSGLVYGNTISWSDEAIPHRVLAPAIGEDYDSSDVKIQSRFAPNDNAPTLKFFPSSSEVMNNLEDYLRRNISSQTPVLALVYDPEDIRGERPRKLDIGTGKI